MQFFLILLTNLAIVFTSIAAHQFGHYLAGLTAGITANVMKIRLFTFPQHVALRNGDVSFKDGGPRTWFVVVQRRN